MGNDTIMRQNNPKNILWRLFRILVEETEVPVTIHQNVMEQIGAKQNEH